MTILKKANGLIIGLLEAVFFRWGKFVSAHPYPVILASVVFTAICTLGFINFRQVHQANLLWIPPESEYNVNQAWLDVNFKGNSRGQLILFKADNVLTPQNIQRMFKLHKAISELRTGSSTFQDICTKIPIVDIFHYDKKRRRRKRETLVTEPLEVDGFPLDDQNTTRLGAGFYQDPLQPLLTQQGITNEELEYETDSSEVTNEEEEEEYIDYKDLWPDYYPDEEEDDGPLWKDYEDYDDDYDYEYDEYNYSPDSTTKKPEIRINYKYYGKARHHANNNVNDGDTGGGDNDGNDDGEDYTPKVERKEPPADIRCGIVKRLRKKCLQNNLLEIWRYKEDLINTTTPQEILEAINNLDRNPWTSYGQDFAAMLGGITRNASGHVIGAQSTQFFMSVDIPDNAELVSLGAGGVELELADANTLEWEAMFLDLVRNTTYPDMDVYVNAAKSFDEVSANAIFFDAIKMAAGYLLMFTYTIFMLGKLNTLEVKMYLAVAGIVSVGMGLMIALGLSAFLGYPYTPTHAALPFLCLGIGIDDMFVIVQCWFNNKAEENPGRNLHEMIGNALKHAGVSITITTLTDVFAFSVGAITRMPGMESFCITTAIGLASIYILQITWFTAFLSLDEKRIKSGRDGVIPCLVHKDFKPSAFSNIDISGKILKVYAKLMGSRVFRAVVIVISLGLLGLGVWGSTLIKQKFDPELLLPTDSYLREWIETHDEMFPSNGWEAHVYTGPIDHTNMVNMDKLVNRMEEMVANGKMIRRVHPWWRNLKNYARDTKRIQNFHDFLNPKDFNMIISDFLYSEAGAFLKKDFKFDGELVCGEPAPPILATRFSFQFFPFEGPSQTVPAKNEINRLVRESGVSATAFTHVKIYAAWETDEIIGNELWRNIGLAMACVAVVTLVLLANLRICLLVLMCVVLTLVDIVGMLHFWGLTIDIITCVTIVLAIGLCVDYSVHIGHAYLIGKGSRLDKSLFALRTIGPAVFNGGFTTFLALALLGFSKSLIFLTFFKVFFLTVVFGLFHGLLLLPVMLCILGPTSEDEEDESVPSSKSSELGSSSVSPDSSAPSSVRTSPQRSPPPPAGQTPGQINRAFIQEQEISVISTSELDKPRSKGFFGKKGSWTLDAIY